MAVRDYEKRGDYFVVEQIDHIEIQYHPRGARKAGLIQVMMDVFENSGEGLTEAVGKLTKIIFIKSQNGLYLDHKPHRPTPA